MILRTPTRLASLVVLAAALTVLTIVPSGSAISGAQKWAIVLCNFTNQTQQPNFTNYQNMFQGTVSSNLDWVDYWRDNSYGNVDVSASTVTGWHTINETRDQWEAKSRFDKQVDCGDQAAKDGFDFTGYYGFVTIFPEVQATLVSSIGTGDTTITVSATAQYDFFPTPPFVIAIDDGSLPNGGNTEILNVTAVSGSNPYTFTVTRGAGGTTAKAHNSGRFVGVPGDIFGRGPTSFTLNGKSFTLGSAVLPSDVNVTGAAHETGHGFSYDHSRKLSTSTQDYNDCYDIMSAYATCSFSGDFGLSNLGSVNAAAGPGITSILLDRQGWLAGGRVFDLDNTSCNQTTMDLVALNQNGISGKFVARIPAAVIINAPGGTTTTSDKYWVEYREATGWDQGVPPGVVLHLKGGDGYAYWVDKSGGSTVGHGGRLILGDEFVDAPQSTYIAVNGIDTGTHKAQITLAGCKINASAAYSGMTTQHYNDVVTLVGDLTVNGSAAPIPNKSVTLSLGSQSCSATTASNGSAMCSFVITQDPGSYSAGISFAGSAAYNSASGSQSFTVTKEDTALTVNPSVSSSHYHDAFTVSGTLSDPDDSTSIAGKPVTFTLGASDTCTATTNGSGVASCSITPTQVPGSYSISAAFGPDTDYQDASASTSFTITKEETTLTYTGPTVILAGSGGASLSAQLVEDGANDNDGDGGSAAPNPAGQTITFTLGSQSCSGTTNSSGVATCSIASISGSTLGPKALSTSFGGDAYYLGSSDSDNVIVFAFPSRGVFALGDLTVAGASAATTVRWWDDGWWSSNSLTGGAAPLSFKGFGGSVATLPTTSPANVCGTSFTTAPGNSPPPTAGVPSYMGVVVASSVTKSGSTIDGSWAKIVVVHVDPGYAPSPGHPGTGTIVATFCP